jgi:transposase
VQTIPAGARFDLTDAQWSVLELLLPLASRPGRPPVHPRRRMIDGVRWRVRVGAPWRDVPERYGPWQSVYSFFRRWQRAGVWARLVTALQAQADAAGLSTGTRSISQVMARTLRRALRPAGIAGRAGGEGRAQLTVGAIRRYPMLRTVSM